MKEANWMSLWCGAVFVFGMVVGGWLAKPSDLDKIKQKTAVTKSWNDGWERGKAHGISLANLTNSTAGRYTDADLVRVMGEGALIGYRLGVEEGRRQMTATINTNIAKNWFGVTYSTNNVKEAK